MSISVTRKDEKEANENVVRRFNRRVLQSGVVATVKSRQRFAKPLSKVERRRKAIIRRRRNDEKTLQIKLGNFTPRAPRQQ
ncbi:MAG: 30S ribosomal protein S21 [Candidatus Nomurabacteria bacterium]|nr:30S ribosomal protein S21 [Candidatus Nomurabacteria bacterium]